MTDYDFQEYDFYFGLRGENLPRGIKIRPWHLKHVQSYEVSIDSQSTEIGIPTVPPDRAQIFDMSGPVRTFEISGVRYDYEEEVSNMDFLFSKPEKSPTYNWKNPVTGAVDEGCISMGIISMFSIVQASCPGFLLAIYSKIKSPTEEDDFVEDDFVEDDLIETGQYNVALSNVSMEYLDRPGGISYSISLIERRAMGNYNYSKLMEGTK